MAKTQLLVFLMALLGAPALADTPPARVVNSETYDASGNGINSTLVSGNRGLDTDVINPLTSPVNTQVVVSGSAIDPRSIRALTSSDVVTANQGGTWNITNVSGTISLPTNAAQETGGNLASIATSNSSMNGKMTAFDLDTGAGVQNVQGISIRLSANGGSVEGATSTNPLRIDPTGTTTQPVSAASLPLPSGAATSALQTTGNTSLASIDGKLTTTSNGLKVDGSAVIQGISATSLPLPTGASTSANQATANSSLSDIDSKLATLGQKNSAGSMPVVLATDQTAIPVSQSGTWTVGRTWALTSGTDSVSAVQSGTWNITNISGTVSLPTGASTSANQSTEITAINNLSAKFGSLGQKSSSGSAPVVLASDQSAIPVTQSGSWTVNQGTANTVGNAWPVMNTDGTNTAAVKAASTPPSSTDPALVVAISPNSPVTAAPPTNTSATGNLTVACASGSACPANSTLQLTTDGASTFGYETHGTWSATVVTDVSYDSSCTSSPGTVIWYQTASVDTSNNEASYLNAWGSSHNNDPWVLSVAGAFCARVRLSAYTSGTVNVTVTEGVGTSVVFAVALGNIPSGSTDIGNPVKIGGIYHSSAPTFSDGQRADLQLNVNGALVTRPLVNTTDSINAVQSGSWTVTANQGTSPWVENVSQFGGSNVATGTGASGAGIPRVTVSNDSNILATQSGSWTTGRTWTLASGSDSVSAVQSGTWNINNISGTVSLPTGAATSANQTNGSEKTQIVDGANATVGPVTALGGTNYLPVVQASSATPGSAVPSRSTVVAGSDGTNAQTLSTDTTGKLNLNNISGTVSLPTGAATSALQTTGNSTLSTISGQLPATLGQKAMSASFAVAIASDQSAIPVSQSGTWTTGRTWTLASGSDSVSAVQSGTWTVQQGGAPWSQNLTQVGGSSIAIGQAAAASSLPVVTQADAAPATVNVTAQDTASTTTSGANSQSIITGTPTAASAASFAIASMGTVTVQVSGTWTGTLSSEVSLDGGTTWYLRGCKQDGVGNVAVTFTANFECRLSVVGLTNYRVRSTAATTGTAVVKVTESIRETDVTVTNSVSLKDATTQSTAATIKAASTAAVGGDTALVVAVSPNNTIAATQSGTWTVQQGSAPWSQNLTQIAGSSIATAATGIAKVGVTDGSGNSIGSTSISSVNHLDVKNASSGATAAAVPSYAQQIGGSDGTDLQSIGVQSATSTSPSSSYFLQVVPLTYSFKNLTGAATTTVKSGAGTLHEFCINNNDVSATATIYDNTAGSGTIIATLTDTLGGGATIATGCVLHDVAYTTGLTVVTTGATANYTAVYK